MADTDEFAGEQEVVERGFDFSVDVLPGFAKGFPSQVPKMFGLARGTGDAAAGKQSLTDRDVAV